MPSWVNHRAIVTEVAGTTRDTLEEQLVLAGFPVRLVDAAGVRDTDDPVEREGVRRAREKAAVADLVLMVVDGSVPLTREDLLALELCRPASTLLVINKCDQAQNCELKRWKHCHTGSPFRPNITLVSTPYATRLLSGLAATRRWRGMRGS